MSQTPEDSADPVGGAAPRARGTRAPSDGGDPQAWVTADGHDPDVAAGQEPDDADAPEPLDDHAGSDPDEAVEPWGEVGGLDDAGDPVDPETVVGDVPEGWDAGSADPADLAGLDPAGEQAADTGEPDREAPADAGLDPGVEAGIADSAGRPTAPVPRQRPPGTGPRSRPGRHAPLPVVAAASAVWAALWSLVPMMIVVGALTLTGKGHPGVGAVARYSVAGWLLAHGVPLRIQEQPIALVPLAITVLAAWRCVRAGRGAVRTIGARDAEGLGPALAVAGCVAVTYGLLGLIGAAIAGGPGLHVPPARAGLTLAVFALVTSLLGGCARVRLVRRSWMRLPAPVRDGVRTGLLGALYLVAAGALAVGVSIATAGPTATAMLRNLHLGFVGQAGITLVCLAYAPNLAVWAAAYLAGPGFTLAAYPQLPVFAGLPTHTIRGAGQLLLVTPLLAGCVAGLLLARRRTRLLRLAEAREARDRADARAGEIRAAEIRVAQARTVDARAEAEAELRVIAAPDDTPPGRLARLPLAMSALVAVPAAVFALAVAGYLAAGSLGSAALAGTGQVGWQFAVIAGLGIGIGSGVGALAAA